MGAINKLTNNYEYPKIANKKNKYLCPSCEKDVIFKNGKIKKPHFSHLKSLNPCFYYDKPSETQIHKDAKLLMKSLLDNKKILNFYKKCNSCEDNIIDICNSYNENTKAIIEYKFLYNNSNRSADVALIENDKIIYIFEICYKHKTKEENRPEPWVEINAEDLINNINNGIYIDEKGNINIECIRNYICNKCIEYEKIAKEKLQKEKEEYIQREKERQEFFLKQQEKKLKEIRQKEEEARIIKIQEKFLEQKKKECKCGIMFINICFCKHPKFELVKISNNLFCINCNKWKCRCD